MGKQSHSKALRIPANIRSISLLLLLALAVCVGTVYAGEIPPQAIQARLDALARVLSIRQAHWRHLTGQFAQIRPARGDTLPLLSPLSFPAAPESITVTVNTYSAPGGTGYEVVYEYSDAGVTWRMVENHGPEPWRARPWALLSPLPIPEAP